MDNTDPRNIVVAYDFSETAEITVDRALAVALRAPQHLLHFVTVLDRTRGLGLRDHEEVNAAYAEEVRELLKQTVEKRLQAFDPDKEVHFFVHTRIGDPAEEVLAAARELGADLVFIGSRGRTGLKRLLLGSVSEHVVREAECPVMVVRPKGYADVPLQQIVEVQPASGDEYVQPHRYSYSNRVAQKRPADWPLN